MILRAHHCEKYFIPMFAITLKNNRLRCSAYEIETERGGGMHAAIARSRRP